MMPEITESDLIAGVYVVQLRPFADERGRFMETFRKEWFPQRSWDIVQTNRSDSKAGVLRGLHYHHHQVDYWTVLQGQIRVGLADLRRSSPTYLSTQTLEMNDNNALGLFIPVGVAHGFLALSNATLLYTVDSYYDGGRDERGVAWDDPDLCIEWGITGVPILSLRDAANPPLKDITAERLPE
jgi:dTDP-4-dehydrorhamnose 3,5-epimerase